MKLYYSKGACSLSTHIIINELNVDCEFISVNLGTKKTETNEDFYNINPKGAVPTLALDNGTRLTENIAIQQYLAETYQGEKLLPVSQDFKRYRVLEWLSFASSDLHKSFSPLFNKSLSDDVKHTIFIPLLKKKLDIVNQQLSQQNYLTGDSFTLPDAYVFVVLRWLAPFKISLDAWEHLPGFFKRIQERPSVKLAMEQEGLARLA